MAARIERVGFTIPYTAPAKNASTGPTKEAVEAALERAGFSCMICNHMLGDRRGVDWSIQHRRPRGKGGTRWPGINLLSNIGPLCGSGVDGCHGEVESYRAAAVDDGWLVKWPLDPATIPVLLHRERYVYLTNDGQYSDHPPSTQEGSTAS